MGTKREFSQDIDVILGQQSSLGQGTQRVNSSNLVYNFICREGKLEKINGFPQFLKSSISSSAIRWIDQLGFLFLFQLGNKLTIETAEKSGVLNTLEVLKSSEKLVSAHLGNRIFFLNGNDLKSYDGTNVGQLGILPPGLGKVPRPDIKDSINGTAGVLPAGLYEYTFTFFDSVTNIESLPVGSLVGQDAIFQSNEFDSINNKLGFIVYPIEFLAGNNQVGFGSAQNLNPFIPIVAGAPTRADKYRMYRRVDGGVLKLVFERDIQDTSVFNDQILTAALGISLNLDDIEPPPSFEGLNNAGAANASGLRHITQFKDSLFAVGVDFDNFTYNDATKDIIQQVQKSNSVLYASDTSIPDYWPFNFPLGPGDDQKAIGSGVLGKDQLLAFKERSAYALLGTSLQNLVPRIIDTKRGCVANTSIQSTPFGVYTLDRRGFLLWDRAGPGRDISDPIEDEIGTINFKQINNAVAAWDNIREVYWCMVPTTGATFPKKTFVHDPKTDSWAILQSQEGSSIFFGYDSENSSRAFIGRESGGTILDLVNLDAVVRAGGNKITARWITQWLHGPAEVTAKRKGITWLLIQARSSLKYEFTVRIYTDFQDGEVVEEIVTSEDNTSKYGSAIYGKGRYVPKVVTHEIKFPVRALGRRFQIEILHNSTSEDNSRLEIISLHIEGGVKSS